MNEKPQNLEAEQAVLGSILLESSVIDLCFLKPDEYFHPFHKRIAEAFQSLQEQTKPIDVVTVTSELGDNLERIGGLTYLMQLAQSVPSVHNFSTYQQEVRKKYIHRKALELLEEKLNQGGQVKEPDKFIAEVQSGIDELIQETAPEREIKHISDVLKDHDETLVERQKFSGMTGILTSGGELDRITAGYQDQDLIIVAARPSIGKTAYVLNGAIRSASAGIPTVIFSLEMADVPIAERIISNLANLDAMKIKTGMLNDDDWSKYTMARSLLSEIPLYIDDTPGMTIQQIANKVKQLKRKHEKLMVYIDYLQLISGGKKFSSDQQEVKFISTYLKRIARDNKCPVCAISSLSRKCEERQDKRPMLSDLRDSGQIEFDADLIMFLYRDDYYDAATEKKNVIEIIVSKQRNGKTGITEMIYMREYNKFVDFDREVAYGGSNVVSHPTYRKTNGPRNRHAQA